jgi:hypothetical protein
MTEDDSVSFQPQVEKMYAMFGLNQQVASPPKAVICSPKISVQFICCFSVIMAQRIYFAKPAMTDSILFITLEKYIQKVFEFAHPNRNQGKPLPPLVATVVVFNYYFTPFRSSLHDSTESLIYNLKEND